MRGDATYSRLNNLIFTIINAMTMKRICMIGGTGFVGRHIAHQLVERGYDVRILTRDRERAKHLLVLPSEIGRAHV